VRTLPYSGPPLALHVVGILLAGVLLAGIVGTVPVPLVAGGALAVAFLVLFLTHPAVGLLFVLLVRASTDLTLGFLAVVGPADEIAGGLVNIGVVLILVLAGGLTILSRNVLIFALPGGRLLALLLLTGVVGMLRSEGIISSMNEWVPVLASLIVYALSSDLYSTPRKLQRVVDVLSASFVLPAVLGLYQLATRQGVTRSEFPVPAVVGTFLHPNTFGFYLVLIVAVFLGQALTQRGARKAMAAAALCVALVLLTATFARVAWAGVLVVFLVVGIVRARILLVAVPLILPILLGFVPTLLARVTDPFGAGGSLADRLYNLWPATLQAWLLATEAGGGGFLAAVNRIVGLGPGIGPAQARYGLAFIPHNDYLRILVEYGILGLTLYIGLIGVLMIVAFRVWRASKSAAPTTQAIALTFLPLTLAFPAMSITDNVFAHTVNQVYFWTLAGLTVTIGRLVGCIAVPPRPNTDT